jgi:hypothetical protein
MRSHSRLELYGLWDMIKLGSGGIETWPHIVTDDWHWFMGSGGMFKLGSGGIHDLM